MNTIIEKIRAEVERLKEKYTNMMPSIQKCSVCDELLAILDALQEQPVMIEWTGNNLKEVIEFTGKSPRFDEWFKTWDEYESYVHSHGNILKLFNEDGTHLEVPVGAWIVKTPDGRNVPSTFLYKEQPVCDGLEEEIINYFGRMPDDEDKIAPARHFAQWQKEQMMKEAVEGEICGRVYDHINVRFADGVCKYLEPKNISHIPADVSKYKVGQKVKIIIVKEEENGKSD